MERFPVHSLGSSPEASKSALRDVQARFGMIPNLAGAMATSPVLIQSFVGIFDKVHSGNFTEPQIQTVLLTDAVTNACTWAVALHTALALQAGIDPAYVEAMRAGRSPSDSKLGALSTLARALIEKRGLLDDHDIERFLAAGFDKDLLLEAITIVAASTITNYTGDIIGNSTLADAILDRIVHNAYRIELSGETLRDRIDDTVDGASLPQNQTTAP